MLSKSLKILFFGIFITSLINPSLGVASHGHQERSHTQINRCDFKTAMRKLWEDHVTWTRIVIEKLNTTDPAETQAAVKRLLKNQKDIGDAVVPFYGQGAGNALTKLLTEHITIAYDLILAVKGGDQEEAAKQTKKWFDNADEISALLSGANPNWPLEEMKHHMHEHLTLTTEEVTTFLNKDWEANVAAYDKVHDSILEMADMLSEGIIKQFPEKFETPK